jgi:hypothetical protein
MDAVVTRQREAQPPSPAQGRPSYSRLTRCLAHVLGRPHAPKPDFTRDMVVALLRSNPTDLFASNNRNAIVTLTISCMRPAGGGAAALSCDLDYNSDYNAGLHQHLCCTKPHLLMRKTGPGTQGPPDALGMATDQQLDVNHQLGLFMPLAGTWPAPTATAASSSGASCRMDGLTVAAEAGVPESILWMQNGHAHDPAARHHVRLTNPDRLYDTWRAFRPRA